MNKEKLNSITKVIETEGTHLVVGIETFLDGHNIEKLEDRLRDCLEDFKVKGTIYSCKTGNVTRTRN